jgi:hypothetical protein
MRSSAEIKAEIDALSAQIANGIPYEYSAAHNVGVYDHILTGDRSGIDAYNRAVEQAVQNKIQRELTASENEKNRANALKIAEIGKAEADAERKRKADELKALKLAQARPEYMELQNKMLKAVDDGNLDEAAIYKSKMEALEAEHGVQFGEDAQDLIDARQAAKQRKAEAAKKESERRLKVADFTTKIPSTFKTDADKTYWYKQIMESDMTDDEKADEIKRIRDIESGDTKNKKAVQGAGASHAGEKTTEALKQKEKTMEIVKVALEKQKRGYAITKDQQDAINLAKQKKWLK